MYTVAHRPAQRAHTHTHTHTHTHARAHTHTHTHTHHRSKTCCQTPTTHIISTTEPLHVISIKYKLSLPDDGSYVIRNMLEYFDVFSTVHHSIELFHQPTLLHSFLYSLTICLLHFYPRRVWSINMPIFRRKNLFTQHLVSSLSVHVCTGWELSTCVLWRRLQRAKIPDAVRIQFFLLKVSMLMLETCRGY